MACHLSYNDRLEDFLAITSPRVWGGAILFSLAFLLAFRVMTARRGRFLGDVLSWSLAYDVRWWHRQEGICDDVCPIVCCILWCTRFVLIVKSCVFVYRIMCQLIETLIRCHSIQFYTFDDVSVPTDDDTRWYRLEDRCDILIYIFFSSTFVDELRDRIQNTWWLSQRRHNVQSLTDMMTLQKHLLIDSCCQ